MNKNIIKEFATLMASEQKYLNACIDGNASNLEYLTFRLMTPYHLALKINELNELVNESAFVDVEADGEVYSGINPNIDLIKMVANNTKRKILQKYAEFWKKIQTLY